MMRTGLFLAALLAGLGIAPASRSQAEPPSLVVVGSDHMLPLVQRLGDAYRRKHPEAAIHIAGGGSGAGVEALQSAQATIAMLARPATPDEVAWIRHARHQPLVTVPIALDALVVFVRPDHPLRVVSLATLSNIFSDQVTTWEDIGVSSEGTMLRKHCPQCADEALRRAPIVLYLPPAKSGPAGIVQTRILRQNLYPRRGERFQPADLVHAVAADANGIGFGEWGATEGVRVLALQRDENAPAVWPSIATIRSRRYPLAHYLSFGFVGPPTGQAKEFLAFVLSEEGQRIVASSKIGAVPLPFFDVAR